jgi:hypothetical protein
MRRAPPKPMTKAAALDLSMFKVNNMGSSGLLNNNHLNKIKESKKENQSSASNSEDNNNNNNNDDDNYSASKPHLYQRVVTISANYNAKDDTELQLKAGDKVKLRGLPEYGWVEGEIDGKVGWFPISSSKELEDIIDEASKQADPNQILGEKLKTMNFLSGYFSRRLKDNEIFQPSVSTPGEKFQFEVEKRKKAEILNNHLSLRANQNFSDLRNTDSHFDSVNDHFFSFLLFIFYFIKFVADECVFFHLQNDMTETNIVYESSSDEEEDDKIDFSQEEAEAISLFSTKPQKVCS